MFEKRVVDGKAFLHRVIDFTLDNIALSTIEYTQPDFLIPFQQAEENDSYELVYEMVEGYECLDNIPQPLSASEFLRIFEGIIRALMECDNYFLDYRNFYIYSSYIYVSRPDYHVKFIYMPSLHNLSEQEAVVRSLINIIRALRILDGAHIKSKFFEMLTDESSLYDIKNVLHEISVTESEKEAQNQAVLPDIPQEESEVVISVASHTKTNNQNFDATVILSEDEILSERAKILRKDEAAPAHYLEDDTSTEFIGFDEWNNNNAFLQCIGNTSGLPEKIEIVLVNGAFSIGRIDYKKLKSPNDFDFPHAERTKVISRVHVRIQFEQGQYYIVDQRSSHGTFVNMSKIAPGIPMAINNDDIISFSIHGVDYRFCYSKKYS